MPRRKLTLMEELILLSLHDEKGSHLAGSWINYGLAGAALLELTLMGRLELAEEKFLVVKDDTSTGDDILDQALQLIGDSPRRKRVKHWIRAVPKKIKGIRDVVAERLVEKGVLKEEEAKVLFVFTVRRFPERDAHAEKEIRKRIKKVIVGSRSPDDRTAGLVALMGACRLTKHVFERGERGNANRRVKEIVKSSRYGKVVAEMIKETEGAMVAVMGAAAAS